MIKNTNVNEKTMIQSCLETLHKKHGTNIDSIQSDIIKYKKYDCLKNHDINDIMIFINRIDNNENINNGISTINIFTQREADTKTDNHKIIGFNKKLGGNVPTIDLSINLTCRQDAPCFKKGCYARKGHYNSPGAIARRERITNLFFSDSVQFFDTIHNEISQYNFIRWHSTGDIPNNQYFMGMIDLAKKNVDKTFLCFTKKFDIINNYIDNGGIIPGNLTVVFSHWGDFFSNNKYDLPVSEVEFKDDLLNLRCIRQYSQKPLIKCVGLCASCNGCWQLKNGQGVKFEVH